MKKISLFGVLVLKILFVAAQGELFQIDFDHLALGPYDEPQWKSDWNNPPWNMGLSEMVQILEDDNNRILQVEYPVGRHCLSAHGANGALWYTDITPSEDLYFTFRFKFKEGYEWVKGGKFHGLKWGGFDSAGEIPSGTNGGYFTNMWRPNGELVFYVYHPDQPTTWGEDLHYKDGDGSNFRAESGRWYTITNRVALNTPGVNDGLIQTWIDGTMVLEKNGMRFRDVDYIKIDELDFSTFFGGCDDSWAPSSDQYMYFDDFEVSSEMPGYLRDNTPPYFSISGNVTVDKNFSNPQYVTASPESIPVGEEGESVTYSIQPSECDFANISIDTSTGLVTITSKQDAYGSQVFIITADDGQSYNSTADVGFILDVQNNFGSGGGVVSTMRINAGGADYIDNNENLFRSDQYFNGDGASYAIIDPINETEDILLYQSERSGESFSYEIPLIDGTYDVKLHFAEIYWNADGERMFDVDIEGIKVIDDYDIHAEAGALTATVKTVSNIELADGVMSINFTASQNWAKISAIEIFPSPAVFPIELKYFNALPRVQSNRVELVWTTSSELNNAFFTIERSIDGSVFEPIVRVSSKGNSVQDQKYRTWDFEPIEGLSYYRLKQTDIDGTFTYHQVVEVNYEYGEISYIRAYPIPIHQGDHLHVEYFFRGEDVPQITVVNASGVVYWQGGLGGTSSNQGFYQLEIPTHNFTPGLYTIIGSTQTEIKSQKFLVYE